VIDDAVTPGADDAPPEPPPDVDEDEPQAATTNAVATEIAVQATDFLLGFRISLLRVMIFDIK
jgi:hypothetical protein